MKQIISRRAAAIFLAFTLALSLTATAFAADKSTLDKAVTDAAAYMLKTVKAPVVGSVGGEWAVIGLARSGYAVPDSYYAAYYKTVEAYVKDCKGVLHEKKYTEYSRVILGLTAAGYDPRNIAGYDLTAPLADFDKTVWQGINGPIWALVALDSNGYANPQRELYIAEILRRQLNDGGWNLSGGAAADSKKETSWSDLTGMALQALARYQDRADVKAAIDRALDGRSKMQGSDGGFNYGSSDAASESTVQVLVALTALGIPADDPRFVKNGNTLVDNILSFQNSDGSFTHTSDGSGNNQMSTEQALYGLAAAQRAAGGKNSLYDMSDATKRGDFLPTETDGLPNKHADVKKVAVTKPGKTFSDVNNHASQTAIEALASREIINGKSDAAFDPDGLVTRAEFAKIVAFSLGLPEKTTGVFTDVPANQWYYAAVGTAYYYEIVKGTSAATFNPGGSITRQDAAVMVARAAKLCGLDTSRTAVEVRDTLAQFGDYRTVADYAAEALTFCYDTKILDDSAFDIQPKQLAARAEIAEMLYRLLDSANLL
jgi:hypothetical protein